MFGRTYRSERIANGQAVYLAVRPDDVDIMPAISSDTPAGMIAGAARAALFVGEGVEYHVEIDGQSTVIITGERRAPIQEGARVWVRLRPDGHSAWPADWSAKRVQV